jgi:hypothetical protein
MRYKAGVVRSEGDVAGVVRSEGDESEGDVVGVVRSEGDVVGRRVVREWRVGRRALANTPT